MNLFINKFIYLILVNEPWDRIPMDVLKDFYWQSYQIVQNLAPHWITLLHDSFRLSVGLWRRVCVYVLWCVCVRVLWFVLCYFLFCTHMLHMKLFW